MRVKEEEDAVGALGEPFDNVGEVVGAADSLLLPGEHAGGVDEEELLEDGARAEGDLELWKGTEREGTEREGTEREGPEREGTERKGTERQESRAAGIERGRNREGSSGT